MRSPSARGENALMSTISGASFALEPTRKRSRERSRHEITARSPAAIVGIMQHLWMADQTTGRRPCRTEPHDQRRAYDLVDRTLLSTRDAAQRLGISRASLYDWLAQSDAGTFVLRGRPVTIDYLQGGARGQGRIRIEAGEVERLKELMRVRPQPARRRRSPKPQQHFPGITVELGRPDH